MGEHRNPLSRTPVRFRPGPAPVAPQGPRWRWQDLQTVTSPTWEFAVIALEGQTRRPLVFLDAPRLPFVASGRVVTSHPAVNHARRFAAVCRRAGVDYIDLSQDFVDFFAATGELPIGFANGQPGKGHYNRHGHRLVAAAVCRYVEQRFPDLTTPRNQEQEEDAIHSD